MKSIISLIAIATVALSSVSGLFAQPRTSNSRSDKKAIERKIPVKRPVVVDNEFGTIIASTEGVGVLIEWQMAKEKGNMGFRVFRVDGGERVQVNEELVIGSAGTAGRFPVYGERYSFFDRDGGLGSTYSIESIDLDNRSVLSSTVSASYSNLKGTIRPADSGLSAKPDSGLIRSEDVSPPQEVTNVIGTQSIVSDPIVHNEVISQPGVRIGVKKEGIYRVPVIDLANAGFNTGSDPANWQLYLNGVQQAITIGPGASYIEFYGNGLDTIESDIRGYFLTVGDGPGKRIRNTVARPSIGTVVLPGYDQTFTYKERFIYLNGIFNGPAENYFGRAIGDTGTNISLTLSGIDYSDLESTIEVKAQGFSFAAHAFQVKLNGQVIGSHNGTGQVLFGGTQTIPTSLLIEGPNQLNLVSATGDFNFFDSVSIRFNRKHAASQNTLKAYTVSSKVTNVTGFTSANTRVFDISRPDDPKLITNIPFQLQGSTYGATIPAGRAMSFFAVEDSAIQAPVSITENEGGLLGVNTHQADLIIIAYKDFMTEAQAWADYRGQQGFDVEVVNVERIFNEFNYGVSSSDSIETFLSYAYNNWQHQPGQPVYVLLIGDASYDARNYQNFGYLNLVPTRLVTTLFEETGSDESLADFDDDGLAEMSIGRIPARQASEVTAALTKVMNWETNLLSDPLSRGALFAVDDPIGYNFQAVSEGLRDQLPAGTPSTFVAKSEPNAQSVLISGLNGDVTCSPPNPCVGDGKYIVNYAGHGSTGSWSNTFFDTTSVGSLINDNNESVYTLLTCLNGYFLQPNINQISLAEVLLAHNNGGAVAAWSSTARTTADAQELMGLRFYDQIGEGNITRLGDLIKDAKTEGLEGSGIDVRLSWALLGDPMLKMR